jgi:malonyl-CoA/methylmalonyl-CoA synthetase
MPSVSDPADWVDDAARRHPQDVFLRTPDGTEVPYAALRERTGRFITALRRGGVTAGDRVAVQVEKCADAVFLYVACLRLGAVFVPINVANTAAEVGYFLRDCEPRLLVGRPSDRETLELLAKQASVRWLETLGPAGDGSLSERLMQCDADEAQRSHDAAAPAAIVYTSGTTGRSKGAMLTRANLASNAAALVEAWRFTARDVLLHTLPLFHVHGLFAALNTVLASASSLVLMPKFDALQALAMLPRVSVFMGVPTHYTRFLKEPALDRNVTRNVRLFVSGSAPLTAATHGEFLERTGHTILERYGMTETLMNTSNPYDGARIAGSVGPALPGVSVRVAGGAGSGGVDAGEIGMLEVRGPNVFAGYWRDPEKTRAEFTADGWFKTGDLGRIDAAGYVFIVGRAKDLVISGGYNVYPKEVELEIDAVAGVLESAVFGVPHPDLGEGVTAAIVLKPGAEIAVEDVIRAVKSRLAGYKVPKRIVVIDELPRNTMGKVQKNLLRADYASLYSGA